MSAQITTQHLSAAVGAMVSSLLLHERPDKSLQGMPTVAVLALLTGAALPFFVAALSRRVAATTQQAPARATAAH